MLLSWRIGVAAQSEDVQHRNLERPSKDDVMAAGGKHDAMKVLERVPQRRQRFVWAGPTEVVGELNPAVLHFEH